MYIILYHYTKLTFVSVYVCVTGGHRKPFDRDSKRSFSLQSYSWTLHQGPHHYCQQKR